MQPIYFDKESYERWYPLAKTGWIGAGSAKIKEKIYPISVLENEQLNPGVLKIQVVIPNS